MHKIVGEANRFKAGLIPEKACKANGRTSSVRVPVRGRGLGYLWHNRAYTAIAARVRPEVRSETKVVMPAMTGPVVPIPNFAELRRDPPARPERAKGRTRGQRRQPARRSATA